MDPAVVKPLASVRQNQYLQGTPRRAFTGVFDFVLPPGEPFRAHVVEAQIPNEPAATLTTSPVPAEVGSDLNQPFNVLVMSCFDTASDRGQAKSALRALPLHLKPHLTLLTGDQVYLDAPWTENLPNNDVALAEVLERKYAHNWQPPGEFSHLLDVAPTICCPDDHEYWNNYPYGAIQLQNTWGPESWGRERWMKIGRRLYESFQHSTSVPFGHPIRLDVPPLSFLVTDARSFRDAQTKTLLKPDALDAVKKWAASLKTDGLIGVFVSGQSLMEDSKWWGSARFKDATLANFDDYAPIMEALHTAMRDGSDILLVTGDVHWSHVAELEPVDALVNAARAYEVICSPSSLLAGFDHGVPPAIHEWAGPKSQTGMRLPKRRVGNLKGNHACILSFRRLEEHDTPSVELKVTFVPLDTGSPPQSLDLLVLRRR